MNIILERPKGFITFTKFLGNKLVGELKFKNAVVSNSKKLIARALGGDSNYIIDNIEVWDGVTLLATRQVVVSYPSSIIVKFNAIFEEADFNGSFDKVVLKNSTHGPFSEVTGLTLSKSNLEKLSIGWEIKPQ